MKLEDIDIRDYINEDHVQHIVSSAVENILTHKVEEIIHEAVEDCLQVELKALMDGDFKQSLRNKLESAIEEMSFFSIFRERGRWDVESSPSYNFLHRVVVDELGSTVRAQARKAIMDMDNYDISEYLGEVLLGAVREGFQK